MLGLKCNSQAARFSKIPTKHIIHVHCLWKSTLKEHYYDFWGQYESEIWDSMHTFSSGSYIYILIM